MFYLYSLKLRAWYCGGTLRGLSFVVKWGYITEPHIHMVCFRDQADAEETANQMTNGVNGVVVVRPLPSERFTSMTPEEKAIYTDTADEKARDV